MSYTARANTYTIISNTNWSNIGGGGITTTSSDILYVKNGANLTVDITNAVIGKIVIGHVGTDGGDGILTFNPGSQLAVTGSTYGGVCQIGASSGNRSGTIDMTNGGKLICNTLDHSEGALISGTGTIEIQSSTTLSDHIGIYYNLTVNAPSVTVTLEGGITCNGSLTVAAGTLTTSASNYALTVNGTTSISSGATLNVNASNAIFKGNFLNSGTFTCGTSTVVLSGTSPQNIGGASVNTFYNLIINNTAAASAITLSSRLTVNNNLTLTDGHLISTSTNILTCGSAATVTLNAPVTQDSSFIKGPMAHTVATTASTLKTFPVGKNKQMHRADLTVTQSTATSTQYTSEFFLGSAQTLGFSLPLTLNKVSVAGYWDISKGAGASITNGMVKLYYVASDGVTEAANLRIAKDNGLGLWLDLGGSGTANTTGSITSSTNFTGFSKFSLANAIAGSNPLPIELVHFEAKAEHSSIGINWKTASETNNDYFTIEKSKDGINFETVTVTKGAGNSNTLIAYSATDLEPYKGISYYRLKQTDFDGQFKHSKMVAVEYNDILYSFNTYLNGDNLMVKVSGIDNQQVLIIISDLLGKSWSSVEVFQEGAYELAQLAYMKSTTGIYVISASSDRKLLESKKILIR